MQFVNHIILINQYIMWELFGVGRCFQENLIDMFDDSVDYYTLHPIETQAVNNMWLLSVDSYAIQYTLCSFGEVFSSTFALL